MGVLVEQINRVFPDLTDLKTAEELNPALPAPEIKPGTVEIFPDQAPVSGHNGD